MFKYLLSDSKEFPIQSFILLDKEENNGVYKDENGKKYVTMSDNDKRAILTILIKNHSLYQMTKILPSPSRIFDGTYHKFYFSNFVDEVEIEAYNIWNYVNHLFAPKNAKIVIKVFQEISEILKKYDININL